MSLMLRRREMMQMARTVSPLPAGYRIVTAVGKNTTGTTKCPVDTGYVPVRTSKIFVSYRFIDTVTNANQIIGSTSTSSGQNGVIVFLMGLRWSIGLVGTPDPVAGNDISQTAWFDGTDAHIIQNGTEYSYTPTQDQWFLTSTRPLFLLGRCSYNGKMYGNSPACMVYSMKIWEGNDLVRDFVPCIRRSDHKAGFYDLAGSISSETGTSFYTNMAGTNTLAWEN